jgi:hypothetical protein
MIGTVEHTESCRVKQLTVILVRGLPLPEDTWNLSTETAQSSTPGERLNDFVCPLERLSSRRLRRADRDGRVRFRCGGSGFEALSTSACSRRSARFRFVACERDRSSTMRISAPTREVILDLVRSSNAEEAATSNRSSTRVELLFECCPPGPPVGENFQESSLSGMSNATITPSGEFPQHRTLRGYARKRPVSPP